MIETIRTRLKIFTVCLVLLTINGCALTSVDSHGINELSIKNLKHPTPHVWSSGQPSKEELLELSNKGIKHIINLRPESETSWDEAAYVKSLGMKYYSIAVAGAAGITLENATSLMDTLKGTGNEPALLHCSSGNRAGGLVALIEGEIKGNSTDDALNEAKKWGLTRLEPLVREKLEALKAQP